MLNLGMAKFLGTHETIGEIHGLISKTKGILYLMSPYFAPDTITLEKLKARDDRGLKTVLIHGKREDFFKEAEAFLNLTKNIEIRYYKELHAKCYWNEEKAIITSLNLLDYSVKKNREMSILLTEEDKSLFTDAIEEAKEISDLADLEVKKTTKKETPKSSKKGFCIRTGKEINFNIKKPLSNNAYDMWARFGDENYPEKFCHYSGEESNGNTCVAKPVLSKYWNEVSKIIK